MLTGDIGKLTAFSARVHSVSTAHGSAATLERISRSMAQETEQLAKEGFDNAENPFGNPWAPKVIDDGNKPGTQSGATKRSIKILRVSARGFAVGATTKQSGWLQRGRRGFSAKAGKTLSWKVGGTRYYAKSVGPAPARPIFPGSKLPRSWAQLYRSAALRELSSTFGRAA